MSRTRDIYVRMNWAIILILHIRSMKIHAFLKWMRISEKWPSPRYRYQIQTFCEHSTSITSPSSTLTPALALSSICMCTVVYGEFASLTHTACPVLKPSGPSASKRETASLDFWQSNFDFSSCAWALRICNSISLYPLQFFPVELGRHVRMCLRARRERTPPALARGSSGPFEIQERTLSCPVCLTPPCFALSPPGRGEVALWGFWMRDVWCVFRVWRECVWRCLDWDEMCSHMDA